MNELKYAKYIITEAEPNHPEFNFMRTRILFLNNEIIPGALRVNCAWYWKGSDEVLTKAHSHNGGEIIAFIGTNPDDPHDLGGEIEMWLGDEKYLLNKSTLVYAPPGLVHCPLIARRVDRPIFHFVASPKEDIHYIDQK